MEVKELVELINAVSNSSLSEFSFEEGNLKLVLKAERNEGNQVVKTSPIIQTVAPIETITSHVVEQATEKSGYQVTSPLVGTFYTAPSPDAEPFVQVGDTVKKGQTLAIIEAMKLMNEIEAEQDGVITDILAQNESIVEYGQPLFIIE